MCAVAGAFAAGHYIRGSSDGGRRDAINGSSNVAEAKDRELEKKPDPNQSSGALPAVEEIRNQISQLFSRHTQFERCELAFAIIPHITVDNWRSVLEAIEAKQKPDDSDSENRLAIQLLLERIGAVAGAVAVEEQLHGKAINKDVLGDVMYGWSAKDPKAAIAWYESLPAKERDQVNVKLVAGVAETDPVKALGLTMQNRNYRPTESPYRAIIDAVVQRGGLRSGEGLIETLNGRADFSMLAKQNIFDALAGRVMDLNNKAGTPTANLDWMGAYLGNNVMAYNPAWKMITQAAASDPAKTLAWLQHNEDQFDATQAKAMGPTLGALWQQQDPQGFADWISNNAANPKHDSFVLGVARQKLRTASLEEAQGWIDLISDPKVRKREGDNLAEIHEFTESMKTQPALSP